MESLGDPELARACRRGDADAWQELIRRFSPLVYRIAYRVLERQPEAEDASQETFMSVYRSFETFDPTRPLAPWIARIAYNACLKRLRDSGRAPERELDPEMPSPPEAARLGNPEVAATRAEERALVVAALSHLAAQDRVLLDLRFREGLSHAEVSEATGIPVNTVKTRVFRARGYLKRILAPLMKPVET